MELLELKSKRRIAGESYAGHYVPAVSHRIHSYNKNVAPDKKINLKGLAIGNGLTNPAIQFGAYADYALMNKIIGQSTHSAIKAVRPAACLCAFTCLLPKRSTDHLQIAAPLCIT